MTGVVERGLPANLEAECLVLGSLLMEADYSMVAEILGPNDFSLEKHRRIFSRMGELYSDGERIDYVTLANKLRKHDQLESVDGLGYLVSLNDGLPTISNLDSYVRI